MKQRIDQRIRRAFASARHSYEQAAVLQREVCNRLLERLSVLGHRVEWILDVGAGTGTGTRGLQRIYPQADCVALDFAGLMLQELQRQDNNTTPALTVCADAACLPFRESLFDLVFSSLTLQWCSNLTSVFSEVRRVLAVNGLFLFATLGPDTLLELRHSWSQVDDSTHVNEFIDMHHIGDALLHAGFSDPVVDVERIVLTHKEVEVLLRDLKALGANTVMGKRRKGLTGPGVMRAMIDAYQQFRTPQGEYPATFEVIYGIARQPDDRHALHFIPRESFTGGHDK